MLHWNKSYFQVHRVPEDPEEEPSRGHPPQKPGGAEGERKTTCKYSVASW